MGWSHTHLWRLKTGRDISAVEVPLGSDGSQTHTRFPSPGFQRRGDKSPRLLAVVTAEVVPHRDGRRAS